MGTLVALLLAASPSRAQGPSRAVDRVADAECPPGWRQRLYRDGHRSVVRLEAIGASLTMLRSLAGIVYPNRSHVVASVDGFGAGRGVRVHFATGEVIGAQMVATDPTGKLGLYRLERPGPAEALEIEGRRPDVGTVVATLAPAGAEKLGNLWPGAPEAAIQVAIVANEGERGQPTVDGPLPFADGSPIFGCEGNVVGIRLGAELVGPEAIRALPLERPSRPSPWSPAHFGAALLVQETPGPAFVGMELAGALTLHDRLQLRLGLDLLGAGQRPSEQRRGLDRSMLRLQSEVSLGYRLLLSERLPIYLVPHAGIVARMDLARDAQKTFWLADPTCVTRGAACDVRYDVHESSRADGSLAPTLGLSVIGLGYLGRLSYEAQLDTTSGAPPTHQVSIGTEF